MRASGARGKPWSGSTEQGSIWVCNASRVGARLEEELRSRSSVSASGHGEGQTGDARALADVDPQVDAIPRGGSPTRVEQGEPESCGSRVESLEAEREPEAT